MSGLEYLAPIVVFSLMIVLLLVSPIFRWMDWQLGFWGYVFLGFGSGTQFNFSDAFPLFLHRSLS